MTVWYFSHKPTAEDLASLYIRADSPELSLLASQCLDAVKDPDHARIQKVLSEWVQL